MKHLGDITKISGYEIEPVDCVTGGSPCQGLSFAGKRKGLADERSGLFMEQIRVVKELRDADRLRGRTGNMVRPRFFVWENVLGAFSSNGGRDFGAVLSEIVRIAEPAAPDVPPPERGKWPMADAYYGDGWSVAYRVHDAQLWGVPQRRRRVALVADFGGLAAPEVLFEREGVSRDTEPRGAAREETAGGAGGGAAGAISFQERAGKPGGGKGVLIQHERTGAISTQCNQRVCVFDARGNGGGKTVCTLTGDHQSRVTDYTALFVPSVAHALKASGNCDFREDSETYVVIGSVVRRLTPLECERLQGYPDGWTDIGEWTDSKGKRRKAADSPRYRALGNSIALPFWFWLLRRVSALYERPATLGSLFDGIGGFPLCWARCNGSSSVRWASEIEAFPIAVTKRHFGDEDAGIDGDLARYL